MTRRQAYTLVETLAVIAILAVVVALTLAAVQKVRARSILLQSQNNLRHIALGLHGYATKTQGRLPGVPNPLQYTSGAGGDRAVLIDIAGYIEGEPSPSIQAATRPDGSINSELLHPRRMRYTSPGDPTIPLWDEQPQQQLDGSPPQPEFRRPYPPTSYVGNLTGLTGSPRLPGSFPDGTSATIAFAERYAIGNRTEYPPTRPSYFSYPHGGPTGPVFGPKPNPPDLGGPRRATFADRGWEDVHPVTANRVTRASVPGKTFQVRPRPEEADASIVQTPFAAGLPVAMFDGSVRTIAPGVAEAAFWAAVTPAAGDAAPLD